MDPTTRQPDSLVIDTPSTNRVVVFADILGFGELTEANPIDVQMLHARSRPFLYGNIGEILSRPANPLTEAFSQFHQSLEGTIMLSEIGHALTAITFSDSVFVATNYLFEASTFAINLARSTLSYKVPVRMGIGFGSFAALKFRSTVSAEGGDHAAQFLGTAVVRAYKAEKSGIKGMRILLHPSVESLLEDNAHCPVPPPISTLPVLPIECSSKERHNDTNVRYELDYWDFATTKERKAWHGLQDMWDVAPDYAEEHYQATAEAINRMRVNHGEASVTDLRRRTLPRGNAGESQFTLYKKPPVGTSALLANCFCGWERNCRNRGSDFGWSLRKCQVSR